MAGQAIPISDDKLWALTTHQFGNEVLKKIVEFAANIANLRHGLELFVISIYCEIVAVIVGVIVILFWVVRSEVMLLSSCELCCLHVNSALFM